MTIAVRFGALISVLSLSAASTGCATYGGSAPSDEAPTGEMSEVSEAAEDAEESAGNALTAPFRWVRDQFRGEDEPELAGDVEEAAEEIVEVASAPAEVVERPPYSTSGADTASHEGPTDLTAGVESASMAGAATYTIVKGDTLWDIAERHLGSGIAYKTLYDDNRDIISNPDLIFPGQVITIAAKTDDVG
ncbi:MAG: LysM peptidoglycan-binding domain-containing protein [Caulobacterales bacterium]|nr:LysM peptidoglycan-binding domain-containing protein [Caulobacterales bacterium]